MLTFMPRPRRSSSDFGERLTAIRKARGLTQVELAELIDGSQRAVSHYENHPTAPPGPILTKLATALKVSTDELLGIKPHKPRERENDPETQRLWKKFQQMLQLPEKDQRAVIRLINSLAGLQEARE
jgi:transcriptional regulator with XRE-family HTH domain